MVVLAAVVFVILAAIAALHVAWGFGLRWPARNERELVALVIGKTGLKKMPPPVQCFVAASAIFAAGFLLLLLAEIIRLSLPKWMATLAAMIAMSVFFGRGIAGFLPVWRARFSQQPFAALDRLYYSPFCFAVATTFMLLILSRV